MVGAAAGRKRVAIPWTKAGSVAIAWAKVGSVAIAWEKAGSAKRWGMRP